MQRFDLSSRLNTDFSASVSLRALNCGGTAIRQVRRAPEHEPVTRNREGMPAVVQVFGASPCENDRAWSQLLSSSVPGPIWEKTKRCLKRAAEIPDDQILAIQMAWFEDEGLPASAHVCKNAAHLMA